MEGIWRYLSHSIWMASISGVTIAVNTLHFSAVSMKNLKNKVEKHQVLYCGIHSRGRWEEDRELSFDKEWQLQKRMRLEKRVLKSVNRKEHHKYVSTDTNTEKTDVFLSYETVNSDISLRAIFKVREPWSRKQWENLWETQTLKNSFGSVFRVNNFLLEYNFQTPLLCKFVFPLLS